MHRKLVLSSLALGLAAVSAPAFAVDLSANLGYNSEYIFRGIPQKTSSAMGGLDLEAGGFYLGTWGADVGEGLEIDYYGGYGFDAGPVSLGIGATMYTYTGDFDDTYKEANFSAGIGWFTFDAAIGTYDNFGGPKLDYQFYSLTAEYNGFYGTVGTFAKDFDGTYFEAGYGNTLTVGETDLFDYTFSVLRNDSDLNLEGTGSSVNFILALSKTFDL